MADPAQLDPTMWTGPLHAGLASPFAGLPIVAPEAGALRQCHAGAAIYGLPFDAGSVGRPGASHGPRAIREISYHHLTYCATLDFDLAAVLRPVDCGNCQIVPGNAERTFARAQADLGEIIDAGALPVMFGGDHSVTIPAVRALRDRLADPGLVLLDTHLDTATHIAGEPLNHCCPIARAVDAGFDPAKIVLVGISGWMNPRSELDYCRQHGIAVIWLEQIWEHGTDWAVARARQISRAADDGVYLSIDIDCLDSAHVAGTCTPTPGGLSIREGLELVRGLARGGLAGVDLVETAPTLDNTPTSALVAGRLALEAMAYHAGAGELHPVDTLAAPGD
ncbi:MAG TPA: agmatinase [Solirubrobacteraceae bacterium]|nr:agmatinase [Solirubrobacteraceae bacterium]